MSVSHRIGRPQDIQADQRREELHRRGGIARLVGVPFEHDFAAIDILQRAHSR